MAWPVKIKGMGKGVVRVKQPPTEEPIPLEGKGLAKASLKEGPTNRYQGRGKL